MANTNNEPITKDLNESRTEALHAILNSLSPEPSQRGTAEGKLSVEQVRKISDKLGKILGDGVESTDSVKRNEKGELVNEEGLPIIDINEPITTTDYGLRPTPSVDFDDPDVLPLWALSPTEKSRRKAERERILDVLEQEEEEQEARDNALRKQKLMEEAEKRKEDAKVEMENLKRARELQKKMGRALVRNVVQAAEKEREQREKEVKEEEEAKATLPTKIKKTVSFVEGPVDSDDEGSKGVEWGDVTPGRLRRGAGSPLPKKDSFDRQTMKMHVVERFPNASRPPGTPIPMGDSDDESDPGPPAATDSDEGGAVNSDNDITSEVEEQHSPPVSDDSEDELGPEAEPEEWDDEVFDTARHQREVALAYYEKRKSIGADVASAMRAHTHEGGEHEWDQPEVPLDATLASSPPKSSVSKWKASHQAQPTASSLASHSLGQSVLSSAQASSLKGAIRIGKLENEKLVSGEQGDSEDEVAAEDGPAREMLELLRRGNFTNIGPGAINMSPPSTKPSNQTIGDCTGSETIVSSTGNSNVPLVAAKPSRISQFKLSLAQVGDMPSPTSSVGSTAQTPLNTFERSSPKFTPQVTPTSTIPFATLQKQQAVMPQTSGRMAIAQPSTSQIPSAALNSPLFSLPSDMQGGEESLSFEPAFGQHPGFHSVILPDPSFKLPDGMPSHAPASTVMASLPLPLPSSTNPAVSHQAPPVRAAVIERRPPITVPVREAASTQSDGANDGPKKKVSRFMSQRSS